jgi:hypothetical protein
MLEVYRDERKAPPQERAQALKPKFRSWTGRVWRWAPDAAAFQLLLKLDATLSTSDIEDDDLRAALKPFTTELSSFPLYLDHTKEGQLPLSWAVGSLDVERGKHAFMRFYDFLDTVPARVLVPLLPAAGAQSDLILTVIPYRLETNRLTFAITGYDLGFHNRIG